MAALVTRRRCACSRSRSPTTWRGSRRRARGTCSSSRCSCRCGRAISSRRTRGARSCPTTVSSTGLLEPLGISFDGYSTVGLWLVFTYLWLPFMILPIYAGLERIPGTLLEASADLGGRSLRTFWSVTLPLVFPAVVAGSIFTFSLTLGDYIAPDLITSQQFIGTVIYDVRGVEPAARRRLHLRSDRGDDRLPARRATAEGVRGALDGRVPPHARAAASRRRARRWRSSTSRWC